MRQVISKMTLVNKYIGSLKAKKKKKKITHQLPSWDLPSIKAPIFYFPLRTSDREMLVCANSTPFFDGV